MSLPPDLVSSIAEVPAARIPNNSSIENDAHANNDQASCETTTQNSNVAPQMSSFVSESIFAVQDKTSCCRQNVGLVISTLMRKSVVSNKHYLDGVIDLIQNFRDNNSPVSPVTWGKLAESIVPVMSTEMVRFSELHLIVGPPANANQLLSKVLELLVNEKGNDWIDARWDVAGIRWTECIESPIGNFNKLTLESTDDEPQVEETLAANQ